MIPIVTRFFFDSHLPAHRSCFLERFMLGITIGLDPMPVL